MSPKIILASEAHIIRSTGQQKEN